MEEEVDRRRDKDEKEQRGWMEKNPSFFFICQKQTGPKLFLVLRKFYLSCNELHTGISTSSSQMQDHRLGGRALIVGICSKICPVSAPRPY